MFSMIINYNDMPYNWILYLDLRAGSIINNL